jgi:malate dehydrogenase (oxaloacetate-decarboxylating)
MTKTPAARWAVTPDAAVSAVRDVASGHGKLEVVSKVHVGSLRDIATLYTPGVGVLVQRIVKDAAEVETLSNRGNTIAVVTDGTAVLGFGRTGPLPAVPVMEGKAIMFKLLAGLDAVPLCLDVKDPAKLAEHIAALEPSFAGFNLEDVAAPHCFATMATLAERLSVPVFHDDQYGTATVIVAGMMNAARLLNKKREALRVVVNGAGAAGTAATKLLLAWGAGEVIVCDRHGILTASERQPFTHMDELASLTNRGRMTGNLDDALKGADAFVGLSAGRLLTAAHIRSMAKDAIVFACANPEPEIMPSDAITAGAAISGSGRFDEPNQCNNVLAFPGIMRGAVDIAAKKITETMCLAASRAIAARVAPNELRFDNILPSPLDPELCPSVAEAVAAQAKAEGLARKHRAPGEIAAGVRERCAFGVAQQAFLQSFKNNTAETTAA